MTITRQLAERLRADGLDDLADYLGDLTVSDRLIGAVRGSEKALRGVDGADGPVELLSALASSIEASELLSVAQIAERYGVSRMSANDWARKPGFPTQASDTGPRRWRADTVEEWVGARRRS